MIKLVSFEEKDFDTLISWACSEEMLVQFAGTLFSFPLTKEQLQHYIQDANRYAYKVLYLPTHITIGHAEIYVSNETVFFCRIIIGDTAYRDKGLGQQIVNSLLEIVFTQLQVEKVELNVFDWNTSAISCYKKVGFVLNAAKTRKRQFKGQLWTVLNMSFDKTAWNGVKDKSNERNIIDSI